MCDIFDEWIVNDVGRCYVQLFDVALAQWYGVRPALCAFCDTCGDSLVVEHNGDIYSCDHFVYPEYRLGNLTDTTLLKAFASRRQADFEPRSTTGCPTSASSAATISPAGANARSTASTARPPARSTSTPSAKGTRPSSATPNPTCATWPTCCAPNSRPPGSCSGPGSEWDIDRPDARFSIHDCLPSVMLSGGAQAPQSKHPDITGRTPCGSRKASIRTKPVSYGGATRTSPSMTRLSEPLDSVARRTG